MVFILNKPSEGEMIKPTVGRVVWFYPQGHQRHEQPWAALIAHVWSDTCVNLAIFNANGKPLQDPPTSVLLVQGDNEVPSGGLYCTWMPYQVGQAQKVEQLEKKLQEAK
jgi:hypothetical protein